MTKTSITEMCAQRKIDFKKLLDRLDDVALTERRLKKYKKVLEELFPE